MALPEESELNDKPIKSDKEGYFKLILSDLKPSTTYPLQFRWQYQDGSFGPWSLTKLLITPSFENLLEPSDPVFEGIPGAIKVTWDGKDAAGNTMTTRADFDRIDIHISGTSFGDGTKPTDNFKLSGTKVFKCEPGIYFGQLKGYRKNGTSSFFSNAVTVTVPPQEEEVQPPVKPKGFSSERVLSGIEVAWDGTYTGNAEWYGFQAINIYAGTSPTATSGTYIKVGQMTANKTGNKIVVPVDGTYVKYDSPVYIHASSINKKAQESDIAANVTSQSTGARSAIPSDLSDNIITNQKLVDGAVNAVKIATGAITEVKIDNNAITAAKIAAGAITEVKIDTGAITSAKIATGAITETKIAADAITSPKIAAGSIEAGKIAAGAITAEKIAASAIDADKIATNAITAIKIAAGAIEAGKIAAGAITADKIAANAIETSKIAADAITSSKIVAGAITAAKIDSLAITSDKIAASAITASKIQAGEIDVTKLSAGTLSVNNLEAGSLKTTTYIRTGTSGGGRIDIAASSLSGIPAGLYIYNSGGTAIFEAPLGGGLKITGDFSATTIATSSGKFAVDQYGIMDAKDAKFTGTITANGGNIGGIYIMSSSLQNSTTDSAATFKLDSAGKARFGGSSGNSIIINPSAGIANSYIFHSSDGGNTSSGKFRVETDGTLYATGASLSGTITAQGGYIAGWTINPNDITSSSGGTVLYNNGKITIGTTGDDSLKLNAGANLAMFAAPGNASIINFYTTTSPTLADSRIQQTSGGDLQIRGWYGGTYRTALTAYTYILQGALAQSYNNATTTGTLIVRRDNASAADLTTDLGAVTRMIQFQKSYADGGDYRGVGGIAATGTASNVSFFVGSDERLKKNIEVFNDTTFLEDIKNINTYKFNEIGLPDTNPKIIGFLAKEFYPKYPDIVMGQPDQVDEDGDPVYMQIMRENLIPHLFNAVKYLSGKVEELENRIDNV